MPSTSQLLAEKFPEIGKEWHPSKNGELTPMDVSYGSGKKVWWLCKKGHEWQAFINNRSKGAGCPYCSGRFATKKNSLLELHPAIARQWDSQKNGALTPRDVSCGSNKKVWWLCDVGHEYEASIKNRTHGKGCPYCAGKKATSEINLESLYPEVAAQWHPTKNKHLLPKTLRPQSNKKVWWLCNVGHEWSARIQDRTVGKNSCPYCSRQTSQLEIRLFCELKAIFAGVEWRKKVDGYEIDILLKSQNIGVEVDGYYWHKDRHNFDRKKQQAIESLGLSLVRVRETPLTMLGPYDVLYEQRQSEKEIIESLLTNIQEILGEKDKRAAISYLKNREFENKAEFRRILSYLPGPPPDQSIAAKQPELASEWNYKKNEPLQPRMFSLQSNKRVWWTCNKGHEWEASIYSRINGRGCPYCSGRLATTENNLQNARPDIALEWHATKNKEITPIDVTPFSHKKVWWECQRGHEWQSTVANRSNARGCPYCSGKRVSADNNLLVVNPTLAAEWHQSRNGHLKASDVTPGSGRKVWWACSREHEWQAAVYSRSKGNGCPFCAGKRRSKDVRTVR